MRILVRLPNWLGDVVMSTGLLRALSVAYPEARIDVIIKKELVGLVPFLPDGHNSISFDKKEFPGLAGAWRFGKKIAQQQPDYDLFFCLPDSFSSAIMAWATGAKKRIGYRNEGRNWLLTQAYQKPKKLHRAEEYLYLLEKFTNTPTSDPQVLLQSSTTPNQQNEVVPVTFDTPYIAVNFNSEAQSRRMPVVKAISILQGLQQFYKGRIVLVGSPKEAAFVQSILDGLPEKNNVVNAAGKTNLPELTNLLQRADLMMSTDSGPAHLAASLNTPLLVFFGAGNEANTAPYNKEKVQVMRLENLPCARCLSNTCRYGLPNCLILLDDQAIVAQVKKMLITKKPV